MAVHKISNLHNFSNMSVNGGNTVGFGPIVTLMPGSYQCEMDVRGAGQIRLQTAAGVVLASGPGGHRGGLLNISQPTSVQFVVVGANPGTTGAGGHIELVSDGRGWSE